MSRKKKIILIVAGLILLIPVHVQCGHLLYGCVTAPDPSGYYTTVYELEPFGITVVETIIGVNLHLYYWRGEDEHHYDWRGASPTFTGNP